MGDAIDPRPQRAAPVEAGEAAPQGEVDLLQQIAPSIGIRLVGPRQSLERRTVGGGGLLVHRVGITDPRGIPGRRLQASFPDDNLPSKKVVAVRRRFLHPGSKVPGKAWSTEKFAHHVIPYAHGGPTTVENLELRCGAHNRHEAEQCFGLFVREIAESYKPDWATEPVE